MKFKLFLVATISVASLLLRWDSTTGCGPEFEESDYSINLFNNRTINRPDLMPFFLTFHALYEEKDDYNYYNRGESAGKQSDREAVGKDWLECLGNPQELSNGYMLIDVVFNTNAEVLRQVKLYIQHKPNRLSKHCFNREGQWGFGSDDEESNAKKDPTTHNFDGVTFSNAFFQYINDRNAIDILDYLIFLKEMRLPDLAADFWGNNYLESATDNNDCLAQIKEAEKLYKQTNTEFLKVRYTYLIAKLYHRNGLYAEAVRAFDKFMPKDAAHSMVYYWALGYKAGALKHLGKKAEAAYYFAQVFVHCPTNRESAFLSWSVKTNEEWQSAYALCKSPGEKIGLHALRGISLENDAVSEIENIYAIDPNSEFLELLLLREINKAESSLLLRSSMLEYSSGGRMPWQDRNFALKNMERLGAIAEKYSTENKVEKPYLWKVAAGYMQFLRGNLNQAREVFAETQKYINQQMNAIRTATKIESWESWDGWQLPNSLSEKDKDTYNSLKHVSLQLNLLEIALHVKSMQSVSSTDEVEIMNMMESFSGGYLLKNSKNNLLDYIMQELTAKYFAQKEYGKAYLCSNTVASLYYDPKLLVINSIISLLQKEDLNKFEEFILAKAFGKKSGMNGNDEYMIAKPTDPTGNNAASLFTNPYYELLELKGTALIAANHFGEAVACLEQIPKNYYRKLKYFYLPADPFRGYVQHVAQYYPDREKIDKRTALTKLDYARRMVELAKTANAKLGNSARSYMELGNAFYNTSYYGACWSARCYYRPSYLWTADYSPDAPDGSVSLANDYVHPDSLNLLLFYCSKDVVHRNESIAKEMLTNALAALTTDEEKAECLFMLAKIELVEFYQSKDYLRYDFNDESKKEENEAVYNKYKSNFASLKGKYSNTQFYKNALENCSYFQEYCNEH